MKTIGVISVRTGDKGQLYNCAHEMLRYCESVHILDPYGLHFKDDRFFDSFEIGIQMYWGISIKNLLDDRHADWIMTAYDDEIPSSRMHYMFNSLILNDYVNTWTSRLKFMWDEQTYRIDKLWNTFSAPTLWRWVPEIEYKWNDDLIPKNEPGPVEDSSVPLLSYRYASDSDRVKAYMDFVKHESEYNEITHMHFKSLIDDKDIKLERLIDE